MRELGDNLLPLIYYTYHDYDTSLDTTKKTGFQEFAYLKLQIVNWLSQ